MARQVIELRFKVGERIVTVRATDATCVEDIYENQMNAVLHRYVTGEDVVPAAGRDVKDFLLKQNLVI